MHHHTQLPIFQNALVKTPLAFMCVGKASLCYILPAPTDMTASILQHERESMAPEVKARQKDSEPPDGLAELKPKPGSSLDIAIGLRI